MELSGATATAATVSLGKPPAEEVAGRRHLVVLGPVDRLQVPD